MSPLTLSRTPSSALRLAIFVPAGPVPAWVARLVGDCTGLPDVELVADEGVTGAEQQAGGEAEEQGLREIPRWGPAGSEVP